jgi:phosphate:Na+ symporter
MLLQSSTATAMMVTSFAVRGAVDLVPALAVMLGANIGTAIIVKALSFDVSFLSPALLIAGYAAFKRSPKGRIRDLGRVGIGLGLMLLALHMLVETIQPVSNAPVLGQLLRALTEDPVMDLLLAAVLTLAAHSSVAVMLLLVGLAAGDTVTPMAAIALVLGANLGGALPPVFETSGLNPANRRVPAGNLLFRAIGCAAALPFAKPIAEWLWQYNPDPRWALTTFHLAFNVAVAVACIGLLGPARALLTWAFPEKRAAAAEVARPLFLDVEALETPYLALSNAAREILRMGDLVDALLRLVPAGLSGRDRAISEQASQLKQDLDRLHNGVKAYLGRLNPADLTERDGIRLSDLIEFAVNLGHVGDILQRRVAQMTSRREAPVREADRAAVLLLHGRVSGDLRLALSTMMTEDQRSARELLDAKRQINEAERAAARDHLAHLGAADVGVMEASSSFLGALRDLRVVNSHFSSIGYAVINPSDRDPPSGAMREEAAELSDLNG